jgi:hypothetical protein
MQLVEQEPLWVTLREIPSSCLADQSGNPEIVRLFDSDAAS